MKNLDFLFPLSCEVAIFVPSTNNVNEAIDNVNEVNEVLAKLSGIFGGATASPALGGWISQSAGLVTEKVTIIYANCTSDQLEEHLNEVITIARDLCKKMSQECISVRVNGKLGFIS